MKPPTQKKPQIKRKGSLEPNLKSGVRKASNESRNQSFSSSRNPRSSHAKSGTFDSSSKQRTWGFESASRRPATGPARSKQPSAGHRGVGRESWVYGRRAVLELISSGAEIKELMLIEGGTGPEFREIAGKAEEVGLAIRMSDRRGFDRLFPGENHQGVAASYSPQSEVTLEEILGTGSTPRLILMLDGVEDPHNVGAVVRSAEVFGANGIVLPERRAAGITPAAVKASAGAALRLPATAVTNLASAIKQAKDAGYWIYGLDPAGDTSIWDEPFDRRLCLVLGAEGKGLARLTRDLCDKLVKIPQVGRIGSLNVSAAAAVVMAELLRRREKKHSFS